MSQTDFRVFNGQTPPKRNAPQSLVTVLVVIAVVVAVLAIFLIKFSPFVTIPSGYTGVVTTFGKVEDYTLSEGFHFKSPIQEVILMNNRTQKTQLSLQAFSSDIQQVDVVCSVNYSVDKSTAQTLYQNIGTDYYNQVMENRILENVKTVFTRYNAERLMKVRNELSVQVKELLEPEMKEYGITIESVSIENVDFTDAFTEAVESKQVAEQTKLKVETEQSQQVSVQRSDAERQIISANAKAEERTILAGADADVQRINADAAAYARKVQAETEAEANRQIAESLTDELIRYRTTDRWDGKLPVVSSGNDATPIINLPTDALVPNQSSAQP